MLFVTGRLAALVTRRSANNVYGSYSMQCRFYMNCTINIITESLYIWMLGAWLLDHAIDKYLLQLLA